MDPETSARGDGMNAAVTGGTGFLGGPLVRQLVSRFDAVRVLVRCTRDGERVRAVGALPVRGDLKLRGGCDGLVQPGDVVFHAAARVDLKGGLSAFRATTVEGTRRLLQQALERRAARFIYVSSAAVYSPEAAGTPVCAKRTPTGPPRYAYYARTKLEAENLVRAECERAGCPWNIVRLGFCYGPGNRALVATLVPMLTRNRLFIIGQGHNRIATCYIEDAARAVVLAGTAADARGRIYDVASDERVTQQQFLDAMADALALTRTHRRVPVGLAYFAGFLADLLARIPGCTPPFGRAVVLLMAADQVVDAGWIRDELGWRPEVNFDEGVRRMAEWYARTRPDFSARPAATSRE